MPRTFPMDHDPEDKLLNNFTFVPVDLDVSSGDRQSCLRANKAKLDTVKKTTIALVSLWFVNSVTARLPNFLNQKTAHDLFARHNIVFSNVPGPKTDMWFFGRPIRKLQSVFLQGLNHQIIAMSAGDKVFMNFVADPMIVKDIQDIPTLYIAELDALGESF